MKIMTTKREMIDYIMENRPEEYEAIDTAIPMSLWGECDTQLCAYAYRKNGVNEVISLPEVICYIQGGIRL